LDQGSGTVAQIGEPKGFYRFVGDKRYELTNHLGNVLSVISDRSLVGANSSLTPDVLSYSDYYPFGMLVPNPEKIASKYRYGFNGKENDNEIMGEGNFEDYGMRSYNPRIGRFFNVDPLAKSYPELTPYQFASDSPIQNIDLDGLEGSWAGYLNGVPREQQDNVIKGIRQGHKKGAITFVTTGAIILDAVYTRGFFMKTLTGAGLLESMNESERGYEAQAKGNYGEAHRRFRNAGEANKIVILGLAAEGAVFGVGKIATTVKNWKVKLIDSNIVNAEFKDAGYAGPYKENVSLGVITTPEEITNLVRLSGPNNVRGAWVTTAKEIEGLSPAQLKDKFSLKYEPTLVTPISIEAKSTIRVGEASAVEKFGTNGGGYQIEV
jgi:RHS repeat-associated protein